jgi:protein involved in polysaccharide export with SLBB domain
MCPFVTRRRIGRECLASRLGVVPVVILSAALSACSSSAMRGDVSGARQARLGAEPCVAETSALAEFKPDERNYKIQTGDQLSLDFYLSPEFNDEVTVAPDGNITLRLVGQVRASGLTPAQLAKDIDWAYSSELRSPDVVVHVKNMPARQVYVEGQVAHPGAFPLQPGMTALQAVAEAGGMTEDAGDDSAVLIRRDACGAAQGTRINLADAAQHPGDGEDVELMAYDVLVVPRSRIADIDLWMDHYVRRLMPMQQYMSMPTMMP